MSVRGRCLLKIQIQSPYAVSVAGSLPSHDKILDKKKPIFCLTSLNRKPWGEMEPGKSLDKMTKNSVLSAGDKSWTEWQRTVFYQQVTSPGQNDKEQCSISRWQVLDKTNPKPCQCGRQVLVYLFGWQDGRDGSVERCVCGLFEAESICLSFCLVIYFAPVSSL